ncbi:bifunctional DNA-formamidopyrimidine glycosylase/DNA-(apurinic or apyrimidinic site) lyase [Corynebacterium aquilae]|uniref:Formamidopyrimidine-DNA glycosylase n=1 Tax=Corynebacterium aquilae DSM 44791 TaxID=1431546 RepID=A0A1L7CGT4_9CORY|nr:bifunctional DNA-formamidopyrimidine glycosylase/DNA-(apurinic or apyrimidinic site) lyase [Corynebacterium aquilae]APT85034.1 formamidopyrimidine-DNA glycosylase [Corynebacterium aquilae DSM 44791]
MPELPEVETVRRGLDTHVVGRNFEFVTIHHDRTARHNLGGRAELAGLLENAHVSGTGRRGKFMWFTLNDDTTDGALSLVVHLGMSGQMLIKDSRAGVSDPNHKHMRARAQLSDGNALWFVDQRTFGYWRTSDLVGGIPESLNHIARDLVDPAADIEELARSIKNRTAPIKVQLLDQTVVSGIGNIYADEMLWRAGISPKQNASRLSLARIENLLRCGQDVLSEAIAQGGTSFDDLYVNVNGQSGYFDRSLNAYGQAGLPCGRCATPMVKEMFRGRSATFCPTCQRAH